jgi:hypothetical protein
MPVLPWWGSAAARTMPINHLMTETVTLRERYLGAPEFEAMLATVERNAELWSAVWRRARVPDEYVRRLAALRRAWHLLVLSEDWCGDAVNAVPVVAKLAALTPNVDLRVLARDENPDLMDGHLTGTSRSIPVVMVLDEEFQELAWWGPRPAELQRFVLGPGHSLAKGDRYRQVRGWYARDAGRAILEEVVATMERVATTIP